ncbi:putative ATPase [Kribbella voronezhensis]|uniref:Putative ATPase n=1 Tax=Kribbella voronezhensis TaxID=2512212 RepID=A0A4R7T6R7_9ACTN|nr:AAA family ATPase [Kribbella voronezhensis]TDU87592.1 putative ATPase [Kribbella voronezhensis]
MEIVRVGFRTLRSLYDVACDLDHFTVITGPNGSGKTNLVSAINLVGEIYRHGLEIAVSRAGGYDNLAHRRSRRATRPISIEVVAKLTAGEFGFTETESRGTTVPRDMEFEISHSFSFKTSSQSVLADYAVVEETITITNEDRLWLIVFRDGQGRVSYDYSPPSRFRRDEAVSRMFRPFSSDRAIKNIVERETPSSSLIFDAPLYLSGILRIFISRLARMRIFQISPSSVRAPGVATPNSELERYGENLPGASVWMKQKDPRAWAQVENLMRSIFPALESIDIAYTEDRRLVLQFKERDVQRNWSSSDLSDGTMQALALFVALYDRRTPLLVIEEPENSVHPWILRQFIDLCREAPKQIVLTTHSPVLLDYVSPNCIRLMTIGSGRSSLRRLLDYAPQVRDLIKEGEMTAFDVYDSGLIPDAMPLGFGPSTDEDE